MGENVFPASPSDLAARPEVLAQIRQTFESFRDHARGDRDAIARFRKDPVDEFLKYAPAQLRTMLSPESREKANKVLMSPEYQERIQKTLHAIDDTKRLQGSGDQSLTRKSWWPALCEIGLWAAIVLALGAGIAASQGALIAPLIALDAGILPVLAAITGLSEGAISAMGAAGGFTLGALIHAACN